MSAQILARCNQAARTYGVGEAATVALQPTTCDIASHDRIALVGQSGSGKSTLLHLLAGLDTPTRGTVTWPGIGERSALRPGRVAVIFQGPALLPSLSVVENVAFPLILDGMTDRAARIRAADTLELLEIYGLSEKLPEEISGGQAQRVAVARALAGEPALILADEPTGQLDRANGAMVVDVLLATADLADAALVIATHDPTVASRLPERWEMHSGQLATAADSPAKEQSCSH